MTILLFIAFEFHAKHVSVITVMWKNKMKNNKTNIWIVPKKKQKKLNGPKTDSETV